MKARKVDVHATIDQLLKKYIKSKKEFIPIKKRARILKSHFYLNKISVGELRDITSIAVALCETKLNVTDNTLVEILVATAKELNMSWLEQQNAEIFQLVGLRVEAQANTVLGNMSRMLKRDQDHANAIIKEAAMLAHAENAKRGYKKMLDIGTSDHAKKINAMKEVKKIYFDLLRGKLKIPISGKRYVKDDFVNYVFEIHSILDSDVHLKTKMTEWKREFEKNK